MGTLCVLVSFPFLFMPAIGLNVDTCDDPDPNVNLTTPNPSTISTTNMFAENCGGDSEMTVVIYYSAFVVLFQFGWATVQISHLSMIPDITSDENSRMALTSVRYAATVGSNILVYCIAWLLLETSMFYIFLSNYKSNQYYLV